MSRELTSLLLLPFITWWSWRGVHHQVNTPKAQGPDGWPAEVLSATGTCWQGPARREDMEARPWGLSSGMMWKNSCSSIFSPEWTFRCHLRLALCPNDLPQTEQPNGFSPVWTVRRQFRLALCQKVFPHSEQLKGFSPVWVLRCDNRLVFCLKPVLHTEHEKGFSPVWTLKCEVRLELWTTEGFLPCEDSHVQVEIIFQGKLSSWSAFLLLNEVRNPSAGIFSNKLSNQVVSHLFGFRCCDQRL